MKTLLTFLAFAILTCNFSFAQNVAQEEKKFQTIHYTGARAGVNVSYFTGANTYTGFHAGLFTEIRFRKSMGYGAEVFYANQGGYINGSPLIQNYVGLPVTFNLYTGKFVFQVGGYGALLLSAFVRRDNQKYDVSGNFNGTDLGAVAGLRWRITKRIGLGTKYFFGIKKLTESYSYYSKSGVTNRSFHGSLTYEF